jgi:hypothetical protein
VILIILRFVRPPMTGRGLRISMAGLYWLLFGGYLLKKGGLLDMPRGHRKAAWIMGAFSGLTILLLTMTLTAAEIVDSVWVHAVRVAFTAMTTLVAVGLILAAREAKEPSPFETWPPCRSDRRRSASVATLAVAAAFIVLAVLGLFRVIGGENSDPAVWLVCGLFYGVVTLFAGIQMWSGRWVAMTVGVLVPLCMFLAIILGTVGLCGLIEPGIAILGSVGAIVCTIFLIRGVTCRPAMS